MRKHERLFWLLLAAWAVAFASACGGAGVTGPSPVVPPSAPPLPQAQPPAFMYGYFVTGHDAPEAARMANTLVVIPSWGEDAEAVARTGAFIIMSAHHVFGNPRETWARDWQRTREWFSPIEKAGRLLGVYVVDEPTGNGIDSVTVNDAVAVVRASGYKTMIAEDMFHVTRGVPRPPVDWYGATCYDYGGVGSYPFERCRSYYQDPRYGLNFVVGQACDLGNGAGDQKRWIDFSRESGKEGLLWWAFRWPGQVCADDDPAVLAQHQAIWEGLR